MSSSARMRPSTLTRARALSAQPSLGARLAIAREARLDIARALHHSPGDASVDALTAAYDAWLEGTAATTVRDGIATIPIRGVLTKEFSFWNWIYGWSSYDQVAHDLDVALADPEIDGILLSIDSPGGQVDGCAELGARILAARARKPIVAHVDGFGASAAYWLASAARDVVLAPTAMVGSIGVVMTFYDLRGYYERLGVQEIEIVSSQSPLKRADPAEEDGRAVYQAHVDALADVFLGAVAEHRGVSVATVTSRFGQGDVFVGSRAVDAGLADRIDTFDATHAAIVEETTPIISVQFTRAQAADSVDVVARLSAAVAAAQHPNEDTMSTKRTALATAATRARGAQEDDQKDPAEDAPAEETPADETPAEDDPANEDEKPEGEGESAEEQPAEEQDPEADALAQKNSAVVARIQQRAAAAERTRISGIRALGRPGLEKVVAQCVDDPACTVEAAALKIVQHDQKRRQAHLAGVRQDEQSLDAPPNHPTAAAASGTTAQVQSITATYLAHRKPARIASPGRK